MFQSLHDLTPIWADLLPSSFYSHYSKYPGLLSVPHKPILYLGPLLLTSEKAMAPHSSTLAWKIPRTVEPGRLQSMGSLRVRHDWATSLSLLTYMHWRRKWHPTPVLLPGKSHGRWSLVGCYLWGRTESDTTETTEQQQHLTFLFLKHLHGWLPHFFQASLHLLLFREIFPSVFSGVPQFPSQPLNFSPHTPHFSLSSTSVLVLFFVSSSVNPLSDLFCKFCASWGWFLWVAFSGFCCPSAIGYDWPLGVLAD